MAESDTKVELSPLPLHRALLTSVTGQKCGPSTPVPVWKMFHNPYEDAMAALAEPMNSRPAARGIPAAIGRSQVNVSARKLAATLWELHGVPHTVYHHCKNIKGKHNGNENFINKGMEGLSPCIPSYKGADEGPCNGAMALSEKPGHDSEDVPQHGRASKNSQVSDAMNHNRGTQEGFCHHRNGFSSHHHQVTDGQSLHLRPSEHSRNLDSSLTPSHDRVRHGSSPYREKAGATTMSTSSAAKHISPVDANAFRVSAENGSALSCELVKVLNEIWSLEEQYNASKAMVATLQGDLEKTKKRVQELKEEQSSYEVDMEMLNKKMADERASLKSRAQAAVDAAVKPLKVELEGERKMKQKLESKHKKLSKQIEEVRKDLVKALQDFEKEQKARELMEDVCDELAREVGEDKAQVEELKRQSVKVREEVEQERRMLQMAEVWREERVQMKLAEARFELEEKNSALDKLRGELEAFLKAKRAVEASTTIAMPREGAPNVEQADLSAIESVNNSEGPSLGSLGTASPNLEGSGVARSHTFNGVDVEGSIDDDLHSIELNMAPCQDRFEGKEIFERGGRVVPLSMNGASKGSERVSLGWTKGNLVEALMVAEHSSDEIKPADPNGVERSAKDWYLLRGSSPPWPREREGFPLSSWRDDGFPRVQGKDSVENLSRSGSTGQSTNQLPLSSQHFHGESSGLKPKEAPGKRTAPVRSSLMHQRDQQFWSSPDPPSSSRGVEEGRPSTTIRDNSLKAKLLEAKLEGQRAKLSNSKIY